MARSDTVTLLPLDRYADIMQIDPYHFNQLNGALAPLGSGCDKVWDQNAWDDLAWTMAQAEEMIATELGFWPASKFTIDEQVSLGLSGISSDWRNAESHTEFRYVQAYGTETLTLKQADAGVEYTNSNANPFDRFNLATIGTPELYADLEACDSACEVAVFFRVADGAEDAADNRWEIRPIKVDIDGSTMRITAESSQFIRPNLIALTEQDCKGSQDVDKWMWNFETANLVSKVDVYCRTVSPILPLCLRWDGVCGCNTTVCEHTTQSACAYPTDNRRGYFIARPASGANVSTIPKNHVPPESVLVNYRSGYPIDIRTCRMNHQLEKAIVKLTNVLLPEPPCGFCDAAQIRWKNDRENVDPLTIEAANLPWDLYTKGALESWRIIKKFARGRGSKM